MTRAYVGVGANLGHPHEQLINARRWLAARADTEVVGYSPIYRSAPVGPEGQEDYLNAVLAIDTSQDAHELLATLHDLEDRAGRLRKLRWGPRTLDLDLLLFGQRRLDGPDLIVPHPRMEERNFVLRPLADLLGDDWVGPSGFTLTRLLDTCPNNRLERTNLDWNGESTARNSDTDARIAS